MLRPGAFLAACVLVGAAALRSSAEPIPAMAPDITLSHVSGKPVPRFEALRYGEVNGRTGPSQDHPIAWLYERTGLPMLILKETNRWRFVRDPDGDEVWIHARTLTEANTAMALERSVLVDAPRANAAPKAQMEAGAIITLGRCEAGHCQVSSGRLNGWAPMETLWGAGLQNGSGGATPG